MAHVLRLTDGTVTVNLAGGSDAITLISYIPKSPQLSPVEAAAWSMEDGGRVTTVTRRNVTEPCTITIEAATNDLARAALNSIETLLKQAEEFQRYGMADKVWIEIQPGTAGTIYRSELFYGKVEVSPDALGLHWHGKAMQCQITWRRQFYWEAKTATELVLANTSGSGIGGITVWNHYDGTTHENYVDIDEAVVGGVLPTPIYMTLENTFNDTDRFNRIYVAHNVNSTPGTLDTILEGEDRYFAQGGLAAAVDATCSGGYYQEITWTGDNWLNSIRWTLPTATLNAAKGNFFRVLARLRTPFPSSTWVRMQLGYPSATPLTVVYQAPDVLLKSTHQLQDLGVLQIPPWLPGADDFVAIDMMWYTKKTGGGTINLDFVQFSPLDGWRRYVPRGYGLPYGHTLHDDGPNDLLWTQVGTAQIGYYRAYGTPIHIWPGKDQRLYFLGDDSSDNQDITRTSEIRVYYRPRRLTL